MNENDYARLGAEVANAVITSCELTIEHFPDVDPVRLAQRVCIFVLMAIAESTDKDSALITVRKDGQSWASHVHMDYLDADPDHLAKDFQIPNAHDNETEECRD